MSVHRSSRSLSRPSLSFCLLFGFLIVLWLAGGASRADAYGQIIVRASAGACIVAMILFGHWHEVARARSIATFLAAATILVLLQLLPLPPALWQALPGREAFLAATGGAAQPWRPWSIAPDTTTNAAMSLIVPWAVFLLIANLRGSELRRLPGIVLLFCFGAMLLGLLQLSGGGFGNPLINDSPGQISGSFANRNHFALFLAIGVMLAPIWAFAEGRRPQWRLPVALSLAIMFLLLIVTSGSRAGMLLGGLAAVLGVTITARDIKFALRRYPGWVFPSLIGGAGAVVGVLILMTVGAGRALSIARFAENDVGEDMRARAFPTVLNMVREYFPAGTGFGSFDPVFRMHEPFALLELTYFNHAHNDWVEVVLDAGLPGLVLLVVAVGWWSWASIAAWRQHERFDPLARTGSAVFLLIFIASVFDYPARTPMMMAMIVLAGWWLSGAARADDDSALPRSV